MVSFLFVADSDEWKLVKEKEDFKVYIRKPDDAAFEQIKIIAITEAGMNEIVAALEDVDNHKNWVYGTGESYVINREAYNNFNYYVTVKMPFPIKDRDVTIHYTRKLDSESGIVEVNSTATSGLKDVQADYIRINEFRSRYTLRPQDNGKIEIEYFLNADPGGSLPSWVVNLVTTKGPTQTMKSLLELLESGYYESADVEGL